MQFCSYAVIQECESWTPLHSDGVSSIEEFSSVYIGLSSTRSMVMQVFCGADAGSKKQKLDG